MTETTVDKGLVAYQNGDYASALSEWLALAEQGNAQACHNLAIMYLNGEGVVANRIEAQKWCTLAAERGHAKAKNHLGYLFEEQGLLDIAVRWWQQAAEAGESDAQNRLGLAYHRGEGVARDDEVAADWFEAAAMQNLAEAQFNFGVLYANSHRFAHAKHWWKKAAEQDYEPARIALEQLSQLQQEI